MIATYCCVMMSLPAFAEDDGPFGFVIGSSVEQYNCVGGFDGRYDCVAPKQHPRIENYTVWASELTGVCRVRGIGRRISTDGYGQELKKEVDSLASQIRVVYGSPTKREDFLAYNSVWNDADDWMMGLASRQRFYFHIWDDVDFRGVSEISVSANAEYSNEGYAAVDFEGVNHQECKKNIERLDEESARVF